MKSSRAIVTGATGFIGHALCRKLVRQGATVQAICRRDAAALPAGVEPIVCDLLDREALTRTLERSRSDYVYHLAGFTQATREVGAVIAAFDANLAPTVNLLTAVSRTGCRRVVLAGSLEEPEPTETASSPYAASKVAGSLYARMFHQLYGTPVALARIFMVYGPGQRDTRKIIPHTILTLLQSGELKLSNGLREVDWIYIDDLVDGLIAMGCSPRLEGESVDLGTGSLSTVRTVVETLAEIVGGGRPRFGALPDRPGEHVRRADAARSERLIGWRAKTSLREGLELTAEHYAKHRRRYGAQSRDTLSSTITTALFGAGCSSWEFATLMTALPV